MPDKSPNSIELVLESALKLTDLQERNEFLNEAAKGDAVLLRHLKACLQKKNTESVKVNHPGNHNDLSSEANRVQPDPPGSSAVNYEEIAAGGAEAFESALNTPVESDLTASQCMFAPGDRIDRYVIKKEISSGAFGMVFLAEDIHLKRPVALKVPRPGSKVEGQAYIDEAQAVARILHPGIVQVYTAGWFEDVTPYVAMQFVEGSSMEKVMGDALNATSKKVLILADVADAIHHAHQNGIIHRDLKPENILLDRNDKPFVADFGLSLVEGAQKESKGDQSGTPLYRSPEQVRGEAHWMDGRSDIWSIGVILYRVLTGRFPFSGETRGDLNEEILHKTPKPPRQMNDHLSEALQEVCLKCLEKRPQDRYQTADSLANALRNAIHQNDRLTIQVGHDSDGNTVLSGLGNVVVIQDSESNPTKSFQKDRSSDPALYRQSSKIRGHTESPSASDMPSGSEGSHKGNTTAKTHIIIPRVKASSDSPTKGQMITTGYMPLDHALEQVDRRALNIFGNKVKISWIDSLYQGINTRENHIQISKSFIDAKKEKTQGKDWHGQEDSNASTDISHQSMSSIFLDSGSLLIVGEAGAGKTMAMLEIVEKMLTVSMQEDSHQHARVPFVLNLSSWKKSQSIDQWIVSELHSKYEIPTETARHWLEMDFLIPMLDGLDEVRSGDRLECLRAINHFIDHYKPYIKANGIVVCCRSYDYLWITEQLRLRHTVRLEPLNVAQVQEYFSRFDLGLERLNKAFAYDPKIKELVQTPLMVGVMRVAFSELKDADFDTALHGVEGSLRDRIFNLYIEQMFKFNQSKYIPTRKQSLVDLLSWFAKRMQADGKSVLMIEEMQPHWIGSRFDHFLYGSLVAVSVGLVYGVLLGLSFGLFSSFSFGISSAVLMGVSGGMGLLLGGYSRSKLISGAIGGIFFGLLFGMEIGKKSGLSSGFEFALIGGLSFALICSVGVGGLRQISLIENVSWRWRGARSTVTYGLIVGICSGVLFSFARVQSNEWHEVLLAGLTYVFGFGAVGTLISGILGGMKNSIAIAKAQPNQGITMSIRNAMIGALVFGLSFGICGATLSWLGYGLSGGQEGGFASASVDGLVALTIGGLIGGLNRGGAAFLKHYALRFVLQSRGILPKKLIQELDLCASMNFLKKIGGGYMFAHGFLLEYFATKVHLQRKSKK